MEWLKTQRELRDMTQKQVADRSKISRAYYTNIELGHKRPTPEIAMRIADALGFEWTRFYSDLAENNGGANVN